MPPRGSADSTSLFRRLFWKRTFGFSGTRFHGPDVLPDTKPIMSEQWREHKVLTTSSGSASSFLQHHQPLMERRCSLYAGSMTPAPHITILCMFINKTVYISYMCLLLKFHIIKRCSPPVAFLQLLLLFWQILKINICILRLKGTQKSDAHGFSLISLVTNPGLSLAYLLQCTGTVG